MQLDMVTFYTFIGALSLAAMHTLSQREGLGLPGDGEGATLFFCIALSTAAWSSIGVLYGLSSDNPSDTFADDTQIPHPFRENRLEEFVLDRSSLTESSLAQSDVSGHDKLPSSKPPSPTGSESSGQTTGPDTSDSSDSELDIERPDKRPK